jgi:predicted house-cleaning noncanonical NTP pyrophosphatase (MazG superfamily)
MITFLFNKLIRDALKDEYEKIGQVAVYKKLSELELLEAFRQKVIEEAKELPFDGTKQDDLVSELADIGQVIDDIAALRGITNAEITEAKEKKFAKKGGFKGGHFVETLSLQDDDEWVSYYRKQPDVYPEVGNSVTSDEPALPLIAAGVYEHYKGKRYEVIGVGLDSETTKPVVVYVPMYESSTPFWVRPYEMFLEFVTVDGKTKERFKKIDE